MLAVSFSLTKKLVKMLNQGLDDDLLLCRERDKKLQAAKTAECFS